MLNSYLPVYSPLVFLFFHFFIFFTFYFQILGSGSPEQRSFLLNGARLVVVGVRKIEGIRFSCEMGRNKICKVGRDGPSNFGLKVRDNEKDGKFSSSSSKLIERKTSTYGRITYFSMHIKRAFGSLT